MFIKLFIFIFILFSSCTAFAGIYRCVDENGLIEFRDRACELTAETEDFLPYVYEPTDPNIVLEKEEKFQKTQKATQKQLALQEQKKSKLEARQKKAAEKAAAKTERRLAHCETTKQKIKEIEAELRGGCKLRRCNTLKKQLAHRQKMQQRYCTPP